MVAQDKVTCWGCNGLKKQYNSDKKIWQTCGACGGMGWVYTPSRGK